MSGAGRLSRGHPLVALLAVLGGWVGGRAATWEPSLTEGQFVSAPSVAATIDPDGAGFVVDGYGGPQSLPGTDRPYSDATVQAMPGMLVGIGGASPYPRYLIANRQPAAGTPWILPGYPENPEVRPYPAFSARHLREDFALSDPLPHFYAPEPPGMGAPQAATSSPVTGPVRPRRWSADAWALLRRDEAGVLASPGVLPATYGASQAGAVLRYRLVQASAYRPTAYMRTTSTTGQLRETSAALGLSARPLPRFPMIAAIEARLTDQGGRRRFQPVAMAVTELPPFPLPAGFRGEAYAQGGYVAGRFATPFADGQFRADRALVTLGKVDARIGGGLWGGMQKGAARLDAGPSASIALPLGRGTRGRVAIDWRFRMAGDAVPGSGPAVTLSAGF